jgi:Flp pilus assembly protein TadB
MKRKDAGLVRTLSSALLIAAGAGLLVYHQGSLTYTSLTPALFAFVAGIALLARRAL